MYCGVNPVFSVVTGARSCTLRRKDVHVIVGAIVCVIVGAIVGVIVQRVLWSSVMSASNSDTTLCLRPLTNQHRESQQSW